MNLLHVGLDLHGLDGKKLVALEGVFNDAESWMRYGAGCWVLWTDEPEQEWCDRIENAIASNNMRFLVCKVDTRGKAGWLSKTAWDWLQDKERLLHQQQPLPGVARERIR
ncbi:MAG: hypothetical protein OXH75_02570 [Acidobacteria bacterium]|nr:hypothetical protein [Acidobacteriota bacterium]